MSIIIKLLVKICPLHFLIASVAEMGWDVCMKNTTDGDIVEGLVVGESQFINRYLNLQPKEKIEEVQGGQD